MRPSTEITADFARLLLSYDSETGVLRWKARTADMFASNEQTAEHNRNAWNAKSAGVVAGNVNKSDGYRYVCVNYISYAAHRLIWLLMTGSMPEKDIDHINCIRLDNRWMNLRVATREQNLANTKLNSRNKSGLKGVHWVERMNAYSAQISIQNRTTFLGFFPCPAAAHFQYVIAAHKRSKEFARYA
jgi:hypothetical protein